MRSNPVMSAGNRRRSRGFSLVELLVAAAVGIIASLAIFQVFAVFEGQKRSTTSGGEAQTNGTLGLYTVERDVRLAGYGINNMDFLGCAIQVYDQVVGGPVTPWNFVPVIIGQGAGSTPGVAGAPDNVAVMYGAGDKLPAPITILVNSTGTTNDFIKIVNARYGFQRGDLVILAETGKPCTLAQVSNIPVAPTDDSTLVTLQAGNYVHPVTGAPTPTRYNNPGGLGTAYTTSGRVFNIGTTPTVKSFYIQDGQLWVQAAGAAAATLYDGIVQLQAQYGKDTDNNTIVDLYDEVTPTTAAGWATVQAVRIAIVARSGLYEKDEVSPATIRLWDNCDAPCTPTTTGPVWTLTADERHYRYKVFQTVVPVRNMIWKQ